MKRRPKDTSAADQFLWSDLPGELERRLAQGVQLRSSPEILAGWCESGFAILNAAAPEPAPDRFLAALHSALGKSSEEIKMTYWDADGHHHEAARTEFLEKTEAKVLDLHTRLEPALDLIFAPAILDFLTDIFDDDAVAFQTLYFENGSQQGCHQDTAFVYVDPPHHFAASWIALEDIVPGSGELFYYPGSQKTDDILFAGGTKALRSGDPDAENYSDTLEQIAAEQGLKRKYLHIPKGSALMWAADLMHGGAPISQPHTRRSLVTHYAPKSARIPYQPHPDWPLRQVRDRAWVVAQQ